MEKNTEIGPTFPDNTYLKKSKYFNEVIFIFGCVCVFLSTFDNYLKTI